MEKVENLMAVAMTGNLQGRKWKRRRPNTISGPKPESRKRQKRNVEMERFYCGNLEHRQREWPFQPSGGVIMQG